ncbi:hypothetical protein ACE6H2_013063 [Prunus campanulata]
MAASTIKTSTRSLLFPFGPQNQSQILQFFSGTSPQHVCRGDVASEDCRTCFKDSVSILLQNCTNKKEAIIWAEHCTVRYSNISIFGVLKYEPLKFVPSPNKISNAEKYKQVRDPLFENLREKAAAGNSVLKFAAGNASVPCTNQTVYATVQCSPDLDKQKCSDCLKESISNITECCGGVGGGRVLRPSCYLRFESNPFYDPGADTLINLPGEQEGSDRDLQEEVIDLIIKMPSFNLCVLMTLVLGLLSLSSLSEAEYRYHVCSNTTSFTPNSTYEFNLKLLLSSLTSNATRELGFYNTTAGSQDPNAAVYGSFLCRADLTSDACQDCVATAARETVQEYCALRKVTIIWYDDCMLRYSNVSFFSNMDEAPGVSLLNVANITDPNQFNDVLLETITGLVPVAANATSGAKKFAAKKANFTAFQELYSLMQCTPDLSSPACDRCLRAAIALLPACCYGKQGGRVLYPSCDVRYEIYPFYTFVTAPPPPLLLPPPPPASVTRSQEGSDRDLQEEVIDLIIKMPSFNLCVLMTLVLGLLSLSSLSEAEYRYHVCSNTTSFTPNSTYEFNLKLLLSSLTSNATRELGFYNTTAGSQDPNAAVYGSFLCRADLTSDACQDCVATAARETVQEYCALRKVT